MQNLHRHTFMHDPKKSAAQSRPCKLETPFGRKASYHLYGLRLSPIPDTQY
jgi:hypothetical protein